MYKVGPMNLDRFRGRDLSKKSRILKVGVEAEGGWERVPPEFARRMVNDNSVNFPQPVLDRLYFRGELPSPPLSPGDELDAWCRLAWPQHVNETCGMHVHMSFRKPFHYSRLMEEHVPATIIAEFTRWADERGLPADHPLRPRLAGVNEYCQHVHAPDLQVRDRDKDYDHHRIGNRYSAVVYRWSRFQTIECRLLPMFDTVELSLEAIHHLLWIMDAILLSHKKDQPILAGVSLQERSIREHYSEAL